MVIILDLSTPFLGHSTSLGWYTMQLTNSF